MRQHLGTTALCDLTAEAGTKTGRVAGSVPVGPPTAHCLRAQPRLCDAVYEPTI